MKRGAIKQVYKTFAPLFLSDWKLTQGAFFRRFGDWLHIVSFNASRFDDEFEVVSCMDFLKRPGEVGGSLLPRKLQEIQHPVTRWISLQELGLGVGPIYQEMVRQLAPCLEAPVEQEGVKHLLHQCTNYDPHLYALCVMAAEEGNVVEAKHWHEQFLRLLADSPYDWAIEKRNNLQKVIDLMDSPPALQAHLQAIVKAKLEAAKLTDLPDLAARS